MNKYGVNVSPCKTPTTKLKKSMSSSGERTIAFLFLEGIIRAETVSLGRPNASSN